MALCLEAVDKMAHQKFIYDRKYSKLVKATHYLTLQEEITNQRKNKCFASHISI